MPQDVGSQLRSLADLPRVPDAEIHGGAEPAWIDLQVTSRVHYLMSFQRCLTCNSDLTRSVFCCQELQSKSSSELWSLFKCSDGLIDKTASDATVTTDLYVRCQILQVLLQREGLYHQFGGATVEQHLEELVQRAGAEQCW